MGIQSLLARLNTHYKTLTFSCQFDINGNILLVTYTEDIKSLLQYIKYRTASLSAGATMDN